MPFGQLLLSIASVQSAIGNSQKNNSNLYYNVNGPSPPFGVYNWEIDALSSVNVNQMKVNGNNETDVTNIEISTSTYNDTTTYFRSHTTDLSVKWYLASFGALVMFFVLISFSEVFCKKWFSHVVPDEEKDTGPRPRPGDPSPPPYELFAPPAYDSLYEKKSEQCRRDGSGGKDRRKIEVFVIPLFGDKMSSSI